MDPLVSAAAGAVSRAIDPTADEAAKVTGNLLQRLLGPSADVIGVNWAEQLRHHNLQKLLAKTEKRATSSGNDGFTKPRLAAAAFDAAQYGDDEILTEYVSGILASSRTSNGGSDAGLPWTSLISRLSSLQLRLHYVLYSSARPLVSSVGDRFFQLKENAVIVSIPDLFAALNMGEYEKPVNEFVIAFLGLVREGLFEEAYAWGPAEFLVEQENERYPYKGNAAKNRVATDLLPEQPLKYGVNSQGALLYLWGLGSGSENMDAYLRDDLVLAPVEPDGLPQLTQGAVLHSACWRDEDVTQLDGGVVAP